MTIGGKGSLHAIGICCATTISHDLHFQNLRRIRRRRYRSRLFKERSSFYRIYTFSSKILYSYIFSMFYLQINANRNNLLPYFRATIQIFSIKFLWLTVPFSKLTNAVIPNHTIILWKFLFLFYTTVGFSEPFKQLVFFDGVLLLIVYYF